MRPVHFCGFFRHFNWRTLKKTFSRATERRLSGLSAEMAYNATLALFPAILAIVTAVGLFEDSLQFTLREKVSEYREIVPDLAWQLLRDFVESITQRKNKSLFSISFVAAIWISSGALSVAMNALDQIHQIPRKVRRPYWKAKLISIILTMAAIALLVVASFLVFISDLLMEAILAPNVTSLLLGIWHLIRWPVALAIVALTFAFIYRFGVSSWEEGRPILPGAMLAAFSWAGLSALFRLYVANFANYNKIYGAVGAVIVLMVWLHMSSLVMLIGDQLNAVVGEEMDKKAKRLAAIQAEEQMKRS
ncbi:YihY/virulence factor BrkB family protein [Oscillatoria salina]|uniref:YihY/virulence factor BrkB family protein n=1 Tax=Oscillatoria salina TaxID=331517 RepID=UPI0013BA11A1|nr:YihY/virulence factor BrkB family protein [Oscillatoria salina]MBZ8181213.1 YihY/virulence factor BrkB family protein [Oscillatoria salina IIICB1]NET90771.1 YihY/virulence factor BrkB family protein [Kamptonema sp. SIO1D9]